MGAGGKTRMKMWPDDRLVSIVWAGSIRVSIDGYQPFTATKGFMVTCLSAIVHIENMGSTPALRFEVRQTGSTPVSPAAKHRIRARHDLCEGNKTAHTSEREENQSDCYLEPVKNYDGTNEADITASSSVDEPSFTSNVLRGPGTTVPPDSDEPSFPYRLDRFSFIIEGRIGMKLEGGPYFIFDLGDVMIAAQGRWHHAVNDPSAAWSTRIPFEYLVRRVARRVLKFTAAIGSSRCA